MINNTVIMGRLTADPELKQTGSGTLVTSFTVAVDRGYTKPGEDRQTDFIDVVAWRHTADFVTCYFRKGSMIAIQGSIRTRSYEDKNGYKRKAVEVYADTVSFCGEKPTKPNVPVEYENTQEPAQNVSTGTAADFEQISVDDDLPF